MNLSRKNPQSAMTLIEVMIAGAITAVMVLGIAEFLSREKRLQRSLELKAEVSVLRQSILSSVDCYATLEVNGGLSNCSNNTWTLIGRGSGFFGTGVDAQAVSGTGDLAGGTRIGDKWFLKATCIKAQKTLEVRIARESATAGTVAVDPLFPDNQPPDTSWIMGYNTWMMNPILGAPSADKTPTHSVVPLCREMFRPAPIDTSCPTGQLVAEIDPATNTVRCTPFRQILGEAASLNYLDDANAAQGVCQPGTIFQGYHGGKVTCLRIDECPNGQMFTGLDLAGNRICKPFFQVYGETSRLVPAPAASVAQNTPASNGCRYDPSVSGYRFFRGFSQTDGTGLCQKVAQCALRSWLGGISSANGDDNCKNIADIPACNIGSGELANGLVTLSPQSSTGTSAGLACKSAYTVTAAMPLKYFDCGLGSYVEGFNANGTPKCHVLPGLTGNPDACGPTQYLAGFRAVPGGGTVAVCHNWCSVPGAYSQINTACANARDNTLKRLGKAQCNSDEVMLGYAFNSRSIICARDRFGAAYEQQGFGASSGGPNNPFTGGQSCPPGYDGVTIVDWNYSNWNAPWLDLSNSATWNEICRTASVDANHVVTCNTSLARIPATGANPTNGGGLGGYQSGTPAWSGVAHSILCVSSNQTRSGAQPAFDPEDQFVPYP